MRDWHHKIIKLDEALTALPANNNTIVIGVFESQIEFENLLTPLHGLNYQARNKGLFKVTNDLQKSSLIGQNGVNVTPNIPINNPSSHTTSVAGIILGNREDSAGNTLPIKGVIEYAELINLPSRINNLLFSTIDNFSYFMNNGGKVINSNFIVSNTPYVYDNNDYIPPNKKAKIINASLSMAINDPSSVAAFDVLFKTLKAYSNNGRGTLFVAAAGNSNNDTSIAQDFGKFKDPLIISAVTIDDNKVFQDTKELKAPYSSYGNRIDMSGPSNGMKHGMHSTTNLKCGELGYEDEAIEKDIINQSNNNELILRDVDQIFPGNYVEIGLPNNFNHEILLIKNVDRTTNKIEFVNDRYYTAKPFVITPAKIKIPVLKTHATLSSSNIITVIDNKGFGYVGQDICIFDGTNHHYPKITFVSSANQFQFSPSLPANFSTTNITVIPGQAICSSNSYAVVGNNTEITFAISDDKIVKSFFVGEMVAVYDKSNGTPNFLAVANIDSINTNGTKTITLDKYKLGVGFTTIEIRSVGYGSYTSSFGGTSAAAPVVSGVAGLIAKANANLNSLEIKYILKSTADKITLNESSSNGRWKDKNGNNVRYSSASSLSAPTIIGSNEIFVNDLTLFSVNDLIEIDGDFKCAIEEKKTDRLVLQFPLKKIYNANDNVKKCSDFPFHSGYYGTGRVNAERAVQLASNWHTSPNVLKPKMEIADIVNNNIIGAVLPGTPVESPDIWVKPILDTSNTTPNGTQHFNTIDTSLDQTIYIRVRNTGNAESFNECDLRVLIAFNDETTPPAFPFPSQWYDYESNINAVPADNKPCVKLLAVKEIPIIGPQSEVIIPIEWKNIAAFWDTYNPLPTQNGVLVPGGARKRAYILAHIAPFDGLETEVLLDNIRNNKQLSCKEIIATHNGVNNRTAYLPGNKLNITVGTETTEKFFDLTMENISISKIDSLQIKATKKKANQITGEVLFQKKENGWSLNDTSNWIAFETPKESASIHTNYKDMIFPHKLTINEDQDEIKLEIINT